MNVAQFAFTHRNSTRCASNRLQMSIIVPESSSVTSKCVDLIAGRYIYPTHVYYSLQPSPTQLNSLLARFKRLQFAVTCQQSIQNASTRRAMS